MSESEQVSIRFREDAIGFSSEDSLSRCIDLKLDEEGYLHCDDGPAVRKKDQQYFFMKNGYLHNANGPAVKTGSLDAPDFFYFYEGKELGCNEYGWIELWRITKNIELFQCLHWANPHGDKVHDLKNLISLITPKDLEDCEDLFIGIQGIKFFAGVRS
jgi:hypothetical protein